MHMGKATFQHFYQLKNQILQVVPSAKYLGVLLSHDLDWSPHISSVLNKAHQRLGFIRRNLKGSPFKCRDTAYISLVRSQLEYCASIWDPNTKKDSNRLEMLQRKAARWARGRYGTVSVTELLKELKWRSLADRRQDQRLPLIYKTLNGLIAIEPDKVDLLLSTRPTRGNTNPMSLQRPRAQHRASPLWNSTIFRTIPQWNSLPADTAEAGSLTIFKNRLACHTP
jgi:hypothetical protein